MEFKGTKGEWKVIGGWDENGNGCFPTVLIHGSEGQYKSSYGRNGITINCSHDQKIESLTANAILISKAPEMLDMLQYLWSQDLLKDKQTEVYELIKQATTI